MAPFHPFFVFLICLCSADIYQIDLTAKGKIFDGVGAISGGGATSKLLFSLNSTLRRNVLQQLFRKEGGVQLLKVEMGGDDQSTDGSEASHWPERDSFKFERGYEWRLVKEAMEINPDMKICILPWAFPHWVRGPLKDPETTARYVVSWIKQAEIRLGFIVYCVGVWNERPWSEIYVKTLRNLLNENNCSEVKIVLSDNYQTPKEDFDRFLAINFTENFDIIGAHYPGGVLPEFVQRSGKTLWASEDYSTLGDGWGCMARTLNWNYVMGNMTATIVWHLASAFYDSFPYFGAGLMSAEPPHYVKYIPTPAFFAFYQTSAFTSPGWHILRHDEGSGLLSGGGTYVTYTNGTDTSIVLETMSWSKSQCMYSSPKPFKVSYKQRVVFTLTGSHSSSEDVWFVVNGSHIQKIKVINGTIDLGYVKRDSLLTVTTLNPPSPPTVANDHIISKDSDNFDDFEDYEKEEEPRWLSPQKGTWVVQDGVLTQTVTKAPVSWCASEVTTPIAVMPGSSLSVDVFPPQLNSSLFVGIRTTGCFGCTIPKCHGIFVAVNQEQGYIFNDLVNKTIEASFAIEKPWNTWRRLSVEVRESSFQTTLTVIFGSTYSDLPVSNSSSKNGMIALGTTDYVFSLWDNLCVKNVFVL